MMHPYADLVYAASADGVYRLTPSTFAVLDDTEAFIRTLAEIRALPEKED